MNNVNKEECCICGEDIEVHDISEETVEGPAHSECMDIDDADLE